jgi:hypothetical protein
MSAIPRTIDEYLAPVSNDMRAALEKLRRAIKSAAPKSEDLAVHSTAELTELWMEVGGLSNLR